MAMNKRGRQKATKCKVCGITDLYRGAYCHKCYLEYRLCNPYYKKYLETVNNTADIKRKDFIKNGDFGDFEYVGGFTTGNCEVTLRCETCGAERKLLIDGVRSAVNGHDAGLKCRVCHPKYGSSRTWDEWVQFQRERGAEQRALTEERKKKERLDKIRIVECAVCGKEFQTSQPNQKTCSKECRKKRQNHRTDHRIPKDAIVDRDITLATLYQRDKGVCYICGCLCDWNDIYKNGNYVVTGRKYPSIDHIIPVSRGGKHAWTNVRLACRECNSKKTDIDPVKFIGTDDFIPENADVLKRVPNKRMKTVKQYTASGELVKEYESTADAERTTGIKQRGIQKCARGECKTYRGFLWTYC
jgi:hypothetical protein